MSGAAGAPEDRFDPDRLDDPSFLEECDSSGALRTVASSAAQVRVAFRAALEAGVPCKEIWRAAWAALELPARER